MEKGYSDDKAFSNSEVSVRGRKRIGRGKAKEEGKGR